MPSAPSCATCATISSFTWGTATSRRSGSRAPPIGVLLFELDGSDFANPIRADQLRSELLNRPVPVVVLAGCMTAAGEALRERLPQWMRGNQNVAHSLIHGESGVQCAIGMRHRLEAADAERFLQAFVLSLFKQSLATSNGPCGRDARDVRAEAVSAQLVGARPLPRGERGAAVRLPVHRADRVRPARRARPGAAGEGLEVAERAAGHAAPETATILELNARYGGIGVPRPQAAGGHPGVARANEAKPGDTVTVSVQQMGSVSVSHLEGRLSFAEAITVRAARPASALKAAGLRAFFALDQPGEVRFVASAPSGEPVTLGAGPLFEVDLTLPGAFPAVYELRVDALASEPRLFLCGWNNAIVVPLP